MLVDATDPAGYRAVSLLQSLELRGIQPPLVTAVKHGRADTGLIDFPMYLGLKVAQNEDN